MSTSLNPITVEDIWKDCVVDPENENADTVRVSGVVHTFLYDKPRLERHRDEIKTLLLDLPTEFRATEFGGGGGWSFLNACNDREGNLWTGMHLIMEFLFTLGEALGYAKCLLPRDIWRVLPGGMPYYMVTV